MTNKTLYDLNSYFDVDKKGAVGFILMLATMEKDDVFNSQIGNIKKISDTTFSLDVTEQSYQSLLTQWESLNDIEQDSIFK